jgi:aspartyl protease family protein
MAAGWLVVCASSAVSIVYYAEIKSLARVMLGLPEPAITQAQTYAPEPREARRVAGSGRVVELRAGSHGHYFARPEVNGRPIDAMVDSGASLVVLTFDDARQAGVYIRDRDFTQYVNTANGVARVAPVTLERVSLGSISVRDVAAVVTEPGKLNQSLLGMSFLNRLQRVDMRSGVLVLQE